MPPRKKRRRSSSNCIYWLLVPASTVVYRSEVSGVYVVGSDGPRLRQVRLGNHFDDYVEILSGADAGEKVALDPVAAGIAAVKSRDQRHE